MTRDYLRKKISYGSLNETLRKILAPYLIVLLIVIAIGSYHQVGFHEGFNIGDWLINYAGGFVRRGFLGEALIRISRAISVNPADLLVFVHAIIFSIYFYFSYRLLVEKKNLLPYTLLLFSPFIFTFAINSQAGGYRKEVLYFSALSCIAFMYRSGDVVRFNRIFKIVLFFYPLVILTDEVGICILPILASLYWEKNDKSLGSFLRIFPLLLGNAVTFFLVLGLHQATPAQVSAIHSAIKGLGYDLGNAGAIGALADSVHTNFLQVKGSFLTIWPLYLFALFLCAIAYLPVRDKLRALVGQKSLLYGYAGSLLILVPLFVIAQDWGRWIYILLVELFILILASDPGANSEKLKNSITLQNLSIRLVLILVYAAFWYLPHVLYSDSRWSDLFHNI